MRSTPKIWFFRAFTALVVPMVLLLLLEGGLRLVGFGRPAGFFLPDDQPGFVRTNPDYVSLFLPAGFDLRPLPHRMAARKPANTVRVVVLGESAAQGIPVPMFGFVPQLRAQLRARYPDKTIEVINTGVVAINSHVVYQMARDLAAYAPDLFVVYLGNNEVVGPYGPGCTYLSDMRPLGVIRLSVWVKSTRTGQLLAEGMARLARFKATPTQWGGMAMFVNNAVRGDDPRLPAVYRNYETNLRDIVKVAAAAGAKTLICTVVSNLKDSPPFLSLNRPDLNQDEKSAWQAAYGEGLVAWRLQENEVARERLQKAYALDPQYANTSFMLGSLERQAGNTKAARKHFLEAQRWDALRFRPDPQLNQIARTVAREFSTVTLVDAARELGSDPAATGDITGRELMLEHVHPDWSGNFHLARLMARGVEQALFSAEPGRGPWLDSDLTAAAVGYTPVERFGLLQRTALITREPPFSHQLTYAEDQARHVREITAEENNRRDPTALRQAREVVRAARLKDPENHDLTRLAVELAGELGDLPGSLELLRHAQIQQPDNFALFADEALKLARLDRGDEAEKILLATVAGCAPRDLAKLIPVIADFYISTKRFAAGRHWFDQALAKQPASRPLQFYRGYLAQAGGDLAEAESDYRAVLQADQGNEVALETLAALLSTQGKTKEAEEISLAHAEVQLGNQANHFRVAEIYETRRQPVEAAQALQAAQQSGPAPLPMHLRLASLLYAQQKKHEAIAQLATAWRISLDEKDPAVTADIRELIRRIRTELAPR